MRPTVIASALAATTLLAACGGSSKPATSPTTAVAPVTTTAPAGRTVPPTAATTAPSTAPATTASTAPAVAACRAASLRGSFLIIPGSAGAGHIEARVVLTNTSAAACTTFGYVGLLLLGASDTPLPTHVVRVPESAPTITLGPGASASAVTRFSPDIPGPGDSQSGACQPVAQGTEITPPNDTHFVVAPGLDSSVCSLGTIDLNPLVAGATAGP